MPPKDLYDFNDLKDMAVAYDRPVQSRKEQADLISAEGMTRFQWDPEHDTMTVLFYNIDGECENVRHVSMDHARDLWAKMVGRGWFRCKV